MNLYETNVADFSGDYLGFTFNGIHSSQLGIVRISEGSRFNENLLPIIQDKTVQVPGGDGSYFFGSYYTQRPFTIQFAFDKMTEAQFHRLKKWLGDKKVHELIFDELPYKAYQAKIVGSATIKHIPFTENQQRIYKGEGSIQFTAYNPFARSVYKYLDNFNKPHDFEWLEASGIRLKNDGETTIDSFLPNNNYCYIYNPGDIEANFNLKLKFSGGQLQSGKIYLDSQDTGLEFGIITAKGSDAGIRINSKLNLIEGIDKLGNKTGNLYNEYLISGSFFKIPMIGPDEELGKFYVDLKAGQLSNHMPELEYDYYYF